MSSCSEKTAEHVLRLLVSEGPAQVKSLVREKLSSATVYRALDLLESRGLTTRKEGVYSATEDGRRQVERQDEATEVFPELPIPALDHTPTPDHRSVLTLGMCATVARWHAVNDRAFVTLVMLGVPGGGKSSTGEALLVLVGGDRHKDLVDVSSAGGKALLVRRDGRGDELYRSHLLQVPASVFDEMDKCDDPKARSTIETVYMAGKPTVSIEGQVIAVRCTSVITMNPVSKEGTSFEELTGFHDSRERRAILVRLPKLEVPAEELDEEFWLTRLIETDKGRAEKLPRPRNPHLKAARRFAEVIKVVLQNKAAASQADPHVLNNLARGATSWLDDERAVRLVAFHWARTQSANGYCYSDWEQRLALFFAPEAVRKARRDRRIVTRSRRLYRAVKDHMGGDFDRACEVIASTGRVGREAPGLTSSLTQVASMVLDQFDGDATPLLTLMELELAARKQGISLRKAAELANEARGLDHGQARAGFKYLTRLFEEGLSPRTALLLAHDADQRELEPEEARYCLALGFEMLRRGFRLEDVSLIARHVRGR